MSVRSSCLMCGCDSDTCDSKLDGGGDPCCPGCIHDWDDPIMELAAWHAEVDRETEEWWA